MKTLTEIGFIKIGEWGLENNELNFKLLSNNSNKNVLYSFVSNGEIKYIGKTVKKISQRLYGYKKPSVSQKTNFRVNKLIFDTLKEKTEIEIYLFIDNAQLKYRNFQINLAAGLEDTLIAELKPKWNYNGNNNSNKSQKGKTIMEENNSPIISNNKFSETIIEVNIGQAYYNDGFFNIREKYSDLFGKHKSIINIQLGESTNEIIEGYVNRTANGKNGYPRIMAGKNYTYWIKENFKEGDILKVEMKNIDYLILKK